VLIKNLVQKAGPQFIHLRKISPHGSNHADHAGYQSLHIGSALQVAISPINDLGPGQPVRDLLRAAQAHLKQIAPAAAQTPQTDPGPVTGEDRLPLAGDELLPTQKLHLIRVMVVHKPTVMSDPAESPPLASAANSPPSSRPGNRGRADSLGAGSCGSTL
jgi:hypothetical protein